MIHPSNARYYPRYQIPTVKHGSESVVWGVFSTNGISSLVRIDGIINGLKYIEILKANLIPYIQETKSDGWIFQHDNDPKHTIKVVKQWLESSRIQVLQWPAESPD